MSLPLLFGGVKTLHGHSSVVCVLLAYLDFVSMCRYVSNISSTENN